MKIRVLTVGKTEKGPVLEQVQEYFSRIKRYHPITWEELPDIKGGTNREVQKEKEGKLLLEKLSEKEKVWLLDEKGTEFSSREFAHFLAKQTGSGSGTITFIIGGPFGFSETIYKRAHGKVSLSRMTFSHQMIRPFFAEQLYRAFSILRNEKYHHD